MRKLIGGFLISFSAKAAIIFLLLIVTNEAIAQDCTLQSPQLFGLSQTAIYCKDNNVGFGVLNSDDDQKYSFTIHGPGGALVRSKGGPLSGNGSQLSVSAFMQSASDAGEYRVTTSKEGCPNTLTTNFYAYYGNIDNLKITAWGGGSVTFRWAASGPRPDVTYEYVITTIANPNNVPVANILTTTDTTVTRTGLTNATTYYMHVRVAFAQRNGNDVDPYFDCTSSIFPWQTSRFTACTGAAAIGTLTPANSAICAGGSVVLTATGGTSYQWYYNNTLVAGTAATFTATNTGQYKTNITTAAGCAGQAYCATVKPTTLPAGVLTGGGTYCIGGTARLGISSTRPDQTYTIRRGTTDIITLTGIGRALETPDTLWYELPILDAGQAGTYSVRTNNGFCTPVDFGNAVIAVSSVNTWTGAVNTAWENPANWSCGLPNASSVLVVPNVTNKPTINSNAICRNITVSPGSRITVNTGFRLTVTAN